jgi:hypothetical protein
MFYELIGRTVVKALKSYLRMKYGPTYMPKSVLAGGTVAVGVAVMLAILRASKSD